MRPQRYHIRFYSNNLTSVSRSESYFLITEDGKQRRIALHDYAEIYNHPGLYEQLFYQRLKCTSPAKLTELLRDAATKADVDATQLCVLDVAQATAWSANCWCKTAPHAWSGHRQHQGSRTCRRLLLTKCL